MGRANKPSYLNSNYGVGMTSRAGIVSRIYWRLLRLTGFGKYAWDQQFKKGFWSRGRHSEFFINKVASLNGGGFLIEFGCAEGILVEELPRSVYSKYLGLDISGIAIGIARERVRAIGIDNCLFEERDMAHWAGSVDASLIVLEESLYYLSPSQVEKFLDKCKLSLLPSGTILVIDHSAEKHAITLEVCRSRCKVIEERVFEGRTYLTLGK